MISRFNMVLWCVVIVLCVVLYNIKYNALEAERRVGALAAQIAEERQAVRLLQAEWALRAEPQRLERLVKRHLNLHPVRADQIATLNDLPLPDLLEPLYAQGPGGSKNRHATEAKPDKPVPATFGLPEPSEPDVLPLPQPRGLIGVENTPGPIAIPVLPRKRPVMKGRR